MASWFDTSRIFVLGRNFLRQDTCLIWGSESSKYQRLSISVIIASGQPFHVGGSVLGKLPLRGLLIGPNVKRGSLRAESSDLTIIDAFIGTEAYQKLSTLLRVSQGGHLGRPLSSREYERLNDLCQPGFGHALSVSEAHQLFNDIVDTLCGEQCIPKPIDERVKSLIQLIEQEPADALTSSILADYIHLSESRLRRLFKDEMQCTLSNYTRSVAFWKSVPHLVNGMNYTDAAHQVGFYDLAHYSRTMKGIFGISPQQAKDYIEHADTHIDIDALSQY